MMVKVSKKYKRLGFLFLFFAFLFFFCFVFLSAAARFLMGDQVNMDESLEK